jgi:imidazolonepropionase-like amidohydrolase
VRAAQAGVVIGFGTDAGSPVVGHDVIAPEMAFMVEIGVVPDNYAAIRTATSVAASINGQSDRRGTLEAGKDADVIVVSGDPLADIDALSNVSMTFVDGRRLV